MHIKKGLSDPLMLEGLDQTAPYWVEEYKVRITKKKYFN